LTVRPGLLSKNVFELHKLKNYRRQHGSACGSF
jgi:hypothetical protein